MKNLIIILAAFAVISCANPMASNQSVQRDIGQSITASGASVWFKSGQAPFIAIMGDSRAAMNPYWTQLDNFLVNVSKLGAPSVIALANIETVLAMHPKYVFLFCGANDMFIDIGSFQSNLMRIAIACKFNGSQLVILDQTLWPAKIPNYSDLAWYIYYCNWVMKSIPDAVYLPINYTADDFIADGVHLSDQGYLTVVNAIHNAYADCIIAN